MADRRMFSGRIIRSARFLQMPEGAQNLYFHMALEADDDGVVETYPIMQMLGSAPDNLKVLMAKDFVVPLNEDQVCFIKDWLEHNAIRADRKIDSVYLPMLKMKFPELEFQVAQPRSDVKNNKRIKHDNELPAPEEVVKTKVVKFGLEDMGMAELLVELIQGNNPEWKMKGNIEKWAEDIEKLHRIDERTYQQISYMIRWTQHDSFWKQNILSAAKLREKFNDLIPKVKAQQQKAQGNINNALFS